jgi:hypothetical protein
MRALKEGLAKKNEFFYIGGYRYPKDMKQVGDELKVLCNHNVKYLIVEAVIIRDGLITFGVRTRPEWWAIA